MVSELQPSHGARPGTQPQPQPPPLQPPLAQLLPWPGGMPQQPEAGFTIGSTMGTLGGGGLSMGMAEPSEGASSSGVGCADRAPAVASVPISISAQSVFMPGFAVAKN